MFKNICLPVVGDGVAVVWCVCLFICVWHLFPCRVREGLVISTVAVAVTALVTIVLGGERASGSTSLPSDYSTRRRFPASYGCHFCEVVCCWRFLDGGSFGLVWLLRQSCNVAQVGP